MSSDRKNPGAIWQGPQNTKWSQLSEDGPLLDPEELSYPQNEEGEELYPGTPISAQAGDNNRQNTDDAAYQEDAPSTPFELIKQLGPYFTMILVPIIFAGLTCLITLPMIITGRAHLQPEAVLPILLVIVAITIAQGVSVYYAGSENGMWVLGTISGFFLFLLIICFVSLGLFPSIVLLLAEIVASVFIIRQCIHTVADGYADIVFAFKKYKRTLQPGLSIVFPWEVVKNPLNTAETQWMSPAQIVQLSHEEDVTLRAVISYQLLPEDAHLAVTQINNWEESLRNLLVTALQTIGTLFTPEDFLTWPQGLQARQPQTNQLSDDDFTGGVARRERINGYLFQQMRDKVAMWGVQINWVIIRDIELVPHNAVVTQKKPQSQPQVQQALPVQVAEAKPVANAVAAVQNIQPPARRVEHPVTPAGTQIPKEEFLIKIYKQVQEGNITDPETIREYAARFEIIARDQQASQLVSFDAARAALNLYDQARKYEEQYTGYDDATRPEWKMNPRANT